MFYAIYKITNKINNKFYIGMHKIKKEDLEIWISKGYYKGRIAGIAQR